jgi:hypothetical protein
VALVYPVLIEVKMIWFLLFSSSVSLVHSGLLFFHSFRCCSSSTWDFVVNSFNLARSCGVYVSVGCITLLLCLLFWFLWCLCGLVPILRILFPLLTFFLVFGFLGFLCRRSLLRPSICLTSQLGLPFFVRFPCSPYGFYCWFLFGAPYCVLTSNSFSYFVFRGYHGAGHSSLFHLLWSR